MKNAWEWLKKCMSHNQAMVAATLLCIILAVAAFGCHVTTQNPFNPNEQVTRSELKIEVNEYAARIELAYQDLAKKEEVLKTLTEAGMAYASGGGINPLGVASTMLGILGIGAVVDNKRKDAVIKSKSNALDKLVPPAEANKDAKLA